MRKYFLIIGAIICAAFSVNGQDKVVERSSKRVPVWYNTSNEGFIITSAIAPDIISAKEQCLNNVRKEIIQSVAENVNFGSESTIEQQTMNDEITHFLDSYSSKFETQVAPIAFLKGVSESKVEDSYWEKRVDKKSKQVSYVYAIKYPFTSLELKKMIREFEELDNQMYSKYLKLHDAYNNIESVEQIDRAIRELDPLISYFFDRVRRENAVSLKNCYRQLYSNIVFKEVSSQLGEYQFSLTLNGKDISISQQPQMSSQIATQLTFKQNGKVNTITYNYDMSEYDTENEIRVAFRLGGKSIQHTIYYTIAHDRGTIYPEKTAYLDATQKSDSTLSEIKIMIYFKSSYKEVIVRTMTLEIPGIRGSLTVRDIDRSFTNEYINLSTIYRGEVELFEKQYGRENILKGNLDVYIPEKRKAERVNFKVSFRPNW